MFILTFAFYLGWTGTWTTMGLSLLLMIILMVMAGLNYRSGQGGTLGFKDMFKVTGGVIVAATLLNFVFNQIYIATMSEEAKSDFTADMVDKQLESIKSFGVEPTVEMEDDMIAQSEKMFSLKSSLLNMVFGILFSLFIALIISLIIKKEPKVDDGIL